MIFMLLVKHVITLERSQNVLIVKKTKSMFFAGYDYSYFSK